MTAIAAGAVGGTGAGGVGANAAAAAESAGLVEDVLEPDAVPRPRQPRPRYAPTWRLAAVFGLVAVAFIALTSVGDIPSAGWLLLGANAVVLAIVAADSTGLPVAADLFGVRGRARVLSLRVIEPLRIVVYNRSNRKVHGALRLPLPAAMTTLVDTVTLTIPRRGFAEIRYEIAGFRRGRHHCLPLEMRVKSPLGLIVRRYAICIDDDVPVYPNVKEAKRLEFAVRSRKRDDAGLRRTRMLGIGTDFDSLREYRPDDDFRTIDWNATARKGVPISRQYRVERDQNVLLVVDCGRLMASPIDTPRLTELRPPGGSVDLDMPAAAVQAAPLVEPDLRRLDLALNAATAMAYVCGAMDDRVGLIAFDREIRVQIPPGRRIRDAILAAMCALEPLRTESDYALAFRIAATMKRAMVVLFTDALDEAAAGPLLAATPTLAQRHLVVAAAVTDPDIESAATVTPGSATAAFRQAVALDLLRQRRTVGRRLRGLGVDVVEATPARFSAALVDAYLRVKMQGRL